MLFEMLDSESKVVESTNPVQDQLIIFSVNLFRGSKAATLNTIKKASFDPWKLLIKQADFFPHQVMDGRTADKIGKNKE